MAKEQILSDRNRHKTMAEDEANLQAHLAKRDSLRDEGFGDVREALSDLVGALRALSNPGQYDWAKEKVQIAYRKAEVVLRADREAGKKKLNL